MTFKQIISEYIKTKSERFFLIRILKDLMYENYHNPVNIRHLGFKLDGHDVVSVFQYQCSDMLHVKTDDRVPYVIDVLTDDEIMKIIEYLFLRERNRAKSI